MAVLEKIKKIGLFSNTADSLEIVARAKHINPIIDKINALFPAGEKKLVVDNGTITAPSIVSTGAAGVYITATTAGLTTAGDHYALLTGSGVLTVKTSATTGGFAGSGVNQIVPITICAAQETIAAAAGGAISVATHYTDIAVDAGGDAYTLAAGVCIGQLKKIMLSATAGGTGVVTSVFAGAATTLTFTNAGEYALLMWNGTDWIALELASVVTLTHKPAIA